MKTKLKLPSPIQELQLEVLKEKQLRLFIKRDDLIHPSISGNKWRKLKHNISKAKLLQCQQILTFGGAYSNHIAATAAAGKNAGIKTIGIIRGDEFKKLNTTLTFAQDQGMELHFISRAEYANKNDSIYLNELGHRFGHPWVIPEGGANKYGVNGCAEILSEEKKQFDFVCCAAGTGTTAAGILKSINQGKLLVFPALKGGEGLSADIIKWQVEKSKELQLTMICKYHFGGYAKINETLVDFVNKFYMKTEIPLDLIYTGKMMYALLDLIDQEFFPINSDILFLHTGGLQGNQGFVARGVNLVF